MSNHVTAHGWAFLFRTADGGQRLTDVVKFNHPVTEARALATFPQWVRDHVISAQSFDREWCMKDH